MKNPSPEAQAEALLTLMTLPGNTMSPEVQARYCELAMKGFDDTTVLQAAEEAALTLERRPTPGEFRNIAYSIVRRKEEEKLNAQCRQLPDDDKYQNPEDYAQEAIERFKATNPTPEELDIYVNAIRQALKQENYARVAFLGAFPQWAFKNHTEMKEQTR